MTARNIDDVRNFIVFGAVSTVRYTNYRGETELRRIIPHCIRHGSTEHHPRDQWLLECFDCDRNALRTYALEGIEPR